MPLKRDKHVSMLFFEFTNDLKGYLNKLLDMGVMKHYDFDQAQYFSLGLGELLWEMLPFVNAYDAYKGSISGEENK